jgi:hypothetical protein
MVHQLLKLHNGQWQKRCKVVVNDLTPDLTTPGVQCALCVETLDFPIWLADTHQI